MSDRAAFDPERIEATTGLNRFAIATVAAKRANEIIAGAPARVGNGRGSAVSTALRELALNRVPVQQPKTHRFDPTTHWCRRCGHSAEEVVAGKVSTECRG